MQMTPGTYLMKRRQAAGLSLEEVALHLLALPVAMTGYGRLHLTALAGRLALLEADRDVLSPAQAKLVRSAFSFDDDIYEQLVARHFAGEDCGLPEPRLCRGCGCSWHDACVTAGGPCAWSLDDPSLCTACERAITDFAAAHLPASEIVIEGVPA